VTGRSADRFREAFDALRADESIGRGVRRREVEAILRDVDAELRPLERLREELRAYLTGLTGRGKRTDGRPAMEDRLGATTYVERGWSLLTKGEADAAAAAFRRALELSPEDPSAAGLLAWAWLTLDRDDDAAALLDRVLSAEPEHALSRVVAGHLALRARRFAEAIGHLTAVIRGGTDRRAVLYAHLYLGRVYAARAMFADAITFLRRAVGLGPGLIEARYELGCAQWFAGEHQAALATWRAASRDGAHSPWAAECTAALTAASRSEDPPRPASF